MSRGRYEMRRGRHGMSQGRYEMRRGSLCVVIWSCDITLHYINTYMYLIGRTREYNYIYMMMFTVASCRMAKTDKDCENTNIEHKVIKGITRECHKVV